MTARALSLAAVLLGALGCPQLTELPEELHVSGSLDRETAGGSGDTSEVEVAYHSSGARAEWWPCDLRLTAQACVGQHHVNVYVALPEATSLGQVGGAGCVSGEEAEGVFELLQKAGGTGSYTLGSDLSAFVVVASDVDEAPGAVLNSDEETTAAARLVSGTLTVTRWAGLEGIGLTLDAETAGGLPVQIDFSGPASSPGAVPTLEDPSSCVERAALEP